VDRFQVLQGAALDLTVTLTDSMGDPITDYTGSETLSARLWPGGNLPTSFAPAASWISAAAGTIAVAHTASQTAGLTVGRYIGTLALVDPTLGPLEAYRWSVEILQGPGTGVAPKTYVDLSDLLEYGSGWLYKLMDAGDEVGFLKQRGRATSWLDDTIIAAWQTGNCMALGDPGYGAVLVGQGNGQLPSAWLRQQLDAGALILRDLVKEIVANRALAIICQGKIEMGDKGEDYRKLARFYRNESEQLARTLRAEIDTNNDGFPELAVNLGVSSMR
jgi:hypothetical protein